MRKPKDRFVSVPIGLDKKPDLSERGAGFIEGYACACEDLRRELTGEGGSGKSYDPMQVDLETATMHSYAFDMKSGGRHHPMRDYESFAEIGLYLLDEAIDWIQNP